MGLFSSKKKITVATTVSRVIEDHLLPNSVKTGLIKGLISGDGQIVENILEDMSSNLAIKAERMYRYAKTHYPYGLPTSNLANSQAGRNVVQSVIEDITGKAVTMVYSHYGPFNSLHYGWQTLVDTKGYEQVTNELKSLTAIKGSRVYLVDMVIVVPESVMPTLEHGALDQWGVAPTAGYTPVRTPSANQLNPHTPVQVSPSATEEYLLVTYAWKIGGTVYQESITLTVPDPADNLEFFQAKYTYQLFEGSRTNPITGLPEDIYRTVTGYFTYQEGEGSHPELDEVHQNNYTGLGSFYPFIYFRYNKTPWGTDTSSQVHKSSKKMMKLLGMDYAAGTEAINANPDIDDVEQAMLTMAVPAVSTNPEETRYLFDFFKRVFVEAGPVGLAKTKVAAELFATFNQDRVPALTFVIQDALFKMALSMQGIYRRRKSGVIGAIGHHTCSVGTTDMTQELPRTGEGETGTYTWTSQVATHFYRKQVAPYLYEEIQVVGLNMSYYVFEGYTATAETLLVPIDYSITKDYNNRDREILYARSLHYVFNSKTETKIKWYQQGWFKAVLIIVAVVITVVTWGADGGAALTAAITAATASLEAFLMTILIAGLKMLVFNYALKLFVKLVGFEAAMIFAAVLAVASAYGYFGTEAAAGAPWAKDLLSVSTGLISSAGDAVGDALLGIKTLAEAFGMEVKEKTDLLNQAKNLLEGNNLLSPFVIFGESPSDYYERTVHSGNIGVTTLESISSYVDIALTLPKLSETVGEIL